MKLAVVLLTLLPASAQTIITGTFKNPDGTNFNGRVDISITRPTVTNFCTTPYQVAAFKTISVAVSGGALGTLSLLAGPCMVAQSTPTATPGAGAGAGATVSFSTGPTDLQASITVNTGASTSATAPVATITFGGGPYIPAPVCTNNPPNNASNVSYLSNGRTLQITATMAAHTSVTFSYYCQVWPYMAKVFDSNNKLMYTGRWVVPNFTTVNLNNLDVR